MTLVVAFLSMIFAAGQFATSVLSLRRTGNPVPSGGDLPAPLDSDDRVIQRYALQVMLIASVCLMAAAFAYLIAHQHYPATDAGQDAYRRQRRIGEYGRVLAFGSGTCALVAWALWGRVSVWGGELLLAALIALLSAGMIFAFYDLPVLTESLPQGPY